MAEVKLSAFVVRAEPVGYEEAMRGEYLPFAVGDAWGSPWSTTWFHVTGRVPEAWAGQRVVARFDLGFAGPAGFTCEALAWKDGRPWRGVDPNHRWLPVDGPQVDFYLEAAANPRATESGPEPAASMIALRESPEPAFVFKQAELVLQPDLSVPPSDLHMDRSHVITAVGHAHIDTAWEWPLREAKRKCARSWSTQLELMDQYPDYVFACSQPAQYQWMKDSYPDIYRRIQVKVARGQWEPVGAMWVEADCNLPSGESLVRQMLHGKRFFMREFGYETRILWLPDVFGYPGNLPQLMREAGCDYFLTQKLSWNDTNKPEHHTFTWEGIDGTRIFTHFPPADTYNGSFQVDEIEAGVRNFKDGDHSSRSLYLFGWGDGGGGPQAEMIEAAHSLGVDLGHARDFFENASADAKGLAVVSGELYFELHRGTYTSQSRTKQLNRHAQQALREAETWSVAAGDYPADLLQRSWKTLLLNQFHDILPGSSIDWVYEQANRELQEVARSASAVAQEAAAKVAGEGSSVAVFNVNSHRRREVICIDDVSTLVEVPPCGWTVLDASQPATASEPVVVSERSMENGFLKVVWDEQGLLTSIWDKVAQREVLSGKGNLLQLHDDNPARWDAWDLDASYRDSVTDLVSLSRLDEPDSDGLRGTVLFNRNFGDSSLMQIMSLRAGSRVLQFDSNVIWRETHKMLKVAFPVSVSARNATYEIQFGHLQRPTHSETSQARAMFEVCAQRWADLADGGYGVALLNDSKHGYDIHGSVMRLSLLRAPTHPDPTADRGSHSFTYALMPHPGDFRQASVIEAAEDLNAPLLVVRSGLAPGTSRSLIEIDTPQVIVDAIKRAEDSDAVILRLYEAWGGECRARISTTLPAGRATLCDLLERERTEVSVQDGILELDFTPFKILTLKLEASTPT
ncbi:MAG: alpha-mannosidase [Candidatus Dormibacteraceae bacterium]